MWDPWRGCHKIGVGCQNCYTFKGDKKRGVDTNQIIKTDNFYAPIERLKNGMYKIKSGRTVYTCFSSDFLLEEADVWRDECFQMMKERNDLHFVFLTKRIHRLKDILPNDWDEGYNNITIGVSVSNQLEVDTLLPILVKSKIKHKNIILQPLIGPVNIEVYLPYVDVVIVGGEYGETARHLDYEWVLSIREQCIKHQTTFEFRQCGTYFVKDGTKYKLKYKELSSQAKKANINIRF